MAITYDTCGIRGARTMQLSLIDNAGRNNVVNMGNIPVIPWGRDTDDNWWRTPGNAYSVPNSGILVGRSMIANTWMVRLNERFFVIHNIVIQKYFFSSRYAQMIQIIIKIFMLNLNFMVMELVEYLSDLHIFHGNVLVVYVDISMHLLAMIFINGFKLVPV
jgi:hypothetical protein